MRTADAPDKVVDERYMIGVRCPLLGCRFDEVRPPLDRPVSTGEDPEAEVMRAHLATHGPNDLAGQIMRTAPWRTTYRLVREEKS